MDGGEELSSSPSAYTLEQWLDDLCVYYMRLGVPYDVFWYGDYCCLKYYEQAALGEREEKNQTLWLNGLYTVHALLATVGNMFAGKSHDKLEYPSEPLPLTREDRETMEERKYHKRMEQLKENLKRRMKS